MGLVNACWDCFILGDSELKTKADRDICTHQRAGSGECVGWGTDNGLLLSVSSTCTVDTLQEQTEKDRDN